MTTIRSLEDVLDRVCAKFCGECGEPLDPPGSQCAACGALPRETRAEAGERLAAEPDPVARAEAERLREEARETVAAAHRLLRDADAAEHRSLLRKDRDAARVRLDAASAGLEGAEAALELAVRAEEMAAGPFADAYGVHQQAVTAAEEARRLRKGAEAEVEAQMRLEKAAGVLARYRDEAHAATQARRDAETALQAVEADIRERERELAEAEAVLDRCEPVPISPQTVQVLAAPLMRIGAGADIDGTPLTVVERLMAGQYGQAVYSFATSDFAGALSHAEEERIKARLAEEATQRPHLRAVGDGRLEASWRKAPVPDGSTPAGGRVTAPPDLAPAPLGRPAPGVLPGLG